MSDETALSPGFLQDDDDAVAETQRDPRVHSERRLVPKRALGVALSVLWWADDVDVANDD